MATKKDTNVKKPAAKKSTPPQNTEAINEGIKNVTNPAPAPVVTTPSNVATPGWWDTAVRNWRRNQYGE